MLNYFFFLIFFHNRLFLLPIIQGINGHKIEDQHISRKRFVYKAGYSSQRASKSLPSCIQALEVYIKPQALSAFRKECSLEYSQHIRSLAKCFAYFLLKSLPFMTAAD